MSRTVRRLKKIDPAAEKGFTHDYEVPKGWSWGAAKDVPLPKVEFEKGWWRFHRDHHRGWSGRKKLYRSDWGAVRSKNRSNLVCSLRNDSKECFFWEDINTQEWD